MAAMASVEDYQCTTIIEPQLWQRGLAAGAASAFSSIAMNPLDIVKTRMQEQATRSPSSHTSPPTLISQATKRSVSMYPGAGVAAQAPHTLQPQQQAAYRSVFDGVLRIVRHEGARVLWRGTDAALLMSVPLVAIYLPLYDHLLPMVEPAGTASPLIAGSLARAVAGFATAPLELARVRMQAAQQGGPGAARPTFWQHLAPPLAATPLQRVTSLWTGLGASLAKDIPFAALYWGLLEPTRAAGLRWLGSADAAAATSPSQMLAINIGSAGLASSIAAAVTTPLDVAKTRLQTSAVGGPRVSLAGTLAGIWRQGGTAALFTGFGPRTARTAAGYAIVMSMYELVKDVV